MQGRKPGKGPGVPVYLNRFLLDHLTSPLSLPAFRVELDPPPSKDEVHPLLALVGREAGGLVRFQNRLIGWEAPRALEGQVRRGKQSYRLVPLGRQALNLRKPEERQALENLYRIRLENILKALAKRHRARVERRGNGLFLWRPESSREEREGWHLYRGSLYRIHLYPDGEVILEVDVQHRFQPTLHLEEWLQRGYPLPKRVTNAYEDEKEWALLGIEEGKDPRSFLLDGGESLLDYHRKKGRLAEGQDPGRVVWVARRKERERIPHLSVLLKPVITMELLAEVAEVIQEALPALQLEPEERLKDIRRFAEPVLKAFGKRETAKPLEGLAQRLPRPSLLARGKKRVGKVADVLEKGALRPGETRLALLAWEGDGKAKGGLDYLEERLQGVGSASGIKLELKRRFLPRGDNLEMAQVFEELSQEGVGAGLLLTPRLTEGERRELKNTAASHGLALQLLNPFDPGDIYRVNNALLGFLAKAGWLFLRLEGTYPADLVVAYDAGGESLRFGGACFAHLTDGTHLGFSLPAAQGGERMAEEVAWELLRPLLLRYRKAKGQTPGRIFLLRDGKIQKEEFRKVEEELRKRNIPYALFSVRKTGAPRLFSKNGPLGDGLFLRLPEEEGGFLLLSAEGGKGTPRPVKYVLEAGEVDLNLEEAARQLYHLSRIYPGSGYRFPRLPAPLHMVDRMVREVARLGGAHNLRLKEEQLFFL